MERGQEVVDWIRMAHNIEPWLALLKTKINLRILQKSGHFLTNWGTVSYTRRHSFSVIMLKF